MPGLGDIWRNGQNSARISRDISPEKKGYKQKGLEEFEMKINPFPY